MPTEIKNISRTILRKPLLWIPFLLLTSIAFGGVNNLDTLSPQDLAPQEKKDVFAEGLVALESTNLRIAAHPDSIQPHWDNLRILYVLGVKDEKYLELGFKELEQLQNLFSKSVTANAVDKNDFDKNLLSGYTGALHVVQAKHGFNLKSKWKNLEKGLPILDTAVARESNQTELRYLRLTCNYYLPFFLGRKAIVKEDFKMLGELLPKAVENYPPKWFVSIAKFVVEKGDLQKTQKDLLMKSMQLAKEKMNQQERLVRQY